MGRRNSAGHLTQAKLIDSIAAATGTTAQKQTTASFAKKKKKKNQTEQENKEQKRKSRDDGKEDKADILNDDDDAMDEDDDDDEGLDNSMTLGERVRALEIAIDGQKGERARRREQEEKKKNSNQQSSFVAPRADSLGTLLAQALQADDQNLLERCLSVDDKRVIEQTCARLTGPAAMKLLKTCLDYMKDKPNRGERLAKWCRATLVRHASFAAVSPNAQRTLQHLQAQIEQRTGQREPLLKLMGRLDLLLYASTRDEVQDAKENARLNEDERAVPAAEYHEAVDVLDDLVVGNGDDDDDDDEFGNSDDDSEGEEWETDNDDDDEEMDSEDEDVDEEDPFLKDDRREDFGEEEDDDDDDDDDVVNDEGANEEEEDDDQ